MNRSRKLSGLVCCLALATAAGAQQGMAPVAVTEPLLPTEAQGRVQLPVVAANQGHEHGGSLLEAAADAAAVFDGVLIAKNTFTPAGMKILVTEYTFLVHEWLKSDARPAIVTLRETGGIEVDGSGMATVHSHKLETDARYLVFLEPGWQQLQFPMSRVLQVLDSGTVMADETGRVIVGLFQGIPVVRDDAEALSLSYLGAGPSVPRIETMGAPDWSSEPLPPQPATADISPEPIPAEALLSKIRAKGATPPAGPQPAGQSLALLGGVDYNYCGWVNGAFNFRTWLPDNDNWAWFNTAELDWDNLVNYTSAGGWILGLVNDAGGNPIRNEAPDANNSRNNAGTPSSAQMTAGGYGTWAANGNPNGICFIWFTGGSCTRIREVDAFANPTLINDELQFRKSMVHELGHGLGFGHEDRYVSIMVSGTWRVPPNYSSNYYLRMDECRGGRAMLNASNANGASWSIRNWRDIGTVSQSHPSWGSSGDVRPNVTTLSTFNADTDDVIQIQHMYIENRGNTDYAGPVDLKIYLSTNNVISASDHLVWSGGWNSFGDQTVWNNGSLNITIPASVPTGDYYIGWIVDGAETELTTGNNTGIMVEDYYGGYAERQIHINSLVPANNTCATATVIGNGATAFSTVYATNDGPAEPNCSFCCGDTQIHDDIWFRYTATCNGIVTASLCGSTFDTKIAVYTTCPVGPGTAIACNDDSACGVQSRVSFAVAQGQQYRIRVGGYNGAHGTGTLQIACSSCYANCDASTVAPVLNVNDFICFQTKFAANDAYANCDASTVAPVLNVNDFICFQTKFAQGCP